MTNASPVTPSHTKNVVILLDDINNSSFLKGQFVFLVFCLNHDNEQGQETKQDVNKSTILEKQS